jgi:hypothetical protein
MVFNTEGVSLEPDPQAESKSNLVDISVIKRGAYPVTTKNK